MVNAADWQLCGLKLEPKRSWHMNWTSADTLIDASEVFNIDRDEAIECDDALSSQADDAAVLNEMSTRGLLPLEEWEMFGRRSSEEDKTSAVTATKSRKGNKSILDITIQISN